MITSIIILIVFLCLLTYRMSIVTSNQNTYNILDFGFFMSVIISVYTIFPSISYLFFKDNLIFLGTRVYNMQPSDNEVAYILLVSVSIVLGIFCSYKLSPSNYNFNSNHISIIPNYVVRNSIWIFIFSSIFIFIIKYSYGLFNPDSYNEVYTNNWKMPTIVRQFYLVFSEAVSFTKIILLIHFLQRKNLNKKLLVLIFLVFILISFDPSKSRADLFIDLLLIFSLFQVFIKKFSKLKILIFAIFGLLIFSLLGLYRSESIGSLLPSSFILIGEFNNIWANAIHINQLSSNENLLLPITVKLNEFISFIPSQFLPFEKMSISNWYMQTFYPDSFNRGLGLGFGIIAQSISDGGILFGFLRGFILGKLFLFFKKIILKNNRWWIFPVYLVFFLGLYSSVRTASFEIFTNPIIKLIFLVLLLRISFKTKSL